MDLWFAGDRFQVLETDKGAKQISQRRMQLDRRTRASNVKKVTLSNLFDTIEEQKVEELKVILKGDVYGTVEAIKETIEELKDDEVKVSVLQASTGSITENDVSMASASKAMVVGFKVRPNNKAKKLSEAERVKVRTYHVVYDLIEDLKEQLESMLKHRNEETSLGKVEVKEIYKISGEGKIAGCVVKEGKVEKGCHVRVKRQKAIVYTGKVHSLRRFKESVKEVVGPGMECGVQIEGYQDFEVGDELQCYTVKAVRRKLELTTKTTKASPS